MPFMNATEFFARVEEDRKNGLHAAAEQRFRDAVADGIDHLPKQDWDKVQRLGDALEEIGGALAGPGIRRGFVGLHLDEPEPTP